MIPLLLVSSIINPPIIICADNHNVCCKVLLQYSNEMVLILILRQWGDPSTDVLNIAQKCQMYLHCLSIYRK